MGWDGSWNCLTTRAPLGGANKVPASSPNLPAPVRKRGRPANSESVNAMKAQIRDEKRNKAAVKINGLKK